MAKNKLSDAKDHLFMALERLNNDDMSAEEVQVECARAIAVSTVTKQIIDIDKMALQAMKMARNGDISRTEASQFTQIEAHK